MNLSESEFKRGGVRATAGPRLGWSRDLQNTNRSVITVKQDRAPSQNGKIYCWESPWWQTYMLLINLKFEFLSKISFMMLSEWHFCGKWSNGKYLQQSLSLYLLRSACLCFPVSWTLRLHAGPGSRCVIGCRSRDWGCTWVLQGSGSPPARRSCRHPSRIWKKWALIFQNQDESL